MSRADNVIDLASYRKRQHSRHLAELMWNLYAVRANYAASQLVGQSPVGKSSESNQA